jgi:cell division transport system permease protein
MRALRYFIQEAVVSLRRSGLSGVLAVVTIALALFVFGAFVLVTASFDRLMAGWNAVSELSVYLRDDITDVDRAAVGESLAASPIVESRQFVSKAEAIRRFKRDFPDLADAAGSLDQNPFPASFDVRLRPRAVSTTDLARLARTLAQAPGVADVRYDRQWLERLATLVSGLRWAGLVLAAALAVAAALTVAAVVRLAMVGRRDEVEIMELVGAPLSAIRGPFVVEGVLQGGLGGLLAIAVLRGVYALVRVRFGPAAVSLGPEVVQFLSLAWSAAIVAGGMVVGCLGGLVAARD